MHQTITTDPARPTPSETSGRRATTARPASSSATHRDDSPATSPRRHPRATSNGSWSSTGSSFPTGIMAGVACVAGHVDAYRDGAWAARVHVGDQLDLNLTEVRPGRHGMAARPLRPHPRPGPPRL